MALVKAIQGSLLLHRLTVSLDEVQGSAMSCEDLERLTGMVTQALNML